MGSGSSYFTGTGVGRCALNAAYFTTQNATTPFCIEKKNASTYRTMASFAALRTVARRRANTLFTAQRQNQRRGLALGGHHGPAPEWKGVDKVVRGYFPEDYQCTYFKIPNSV